MAQVVEFPCAVILSANVDHCVQWSCRKCRSYALEPERRGSSSNTSGRGGGGEAKLRCKACRTSNAGVPSFFLNLTFDIDGVFARVVASDKIVEKLVGCTADKWHRLRARDPGFASLVGCALRGTVCTLALKLPDPKRKSTRDPKMVGFEPRRPFTPYFQAEVAKRKVDSVAKPHESDNTKRL